MIAGTADNKRLRRLAETRTPVSPDAFRDALVASGVRSPTAGFLLEQIQPYYPDFLTPDPSDRWQGTLRIDPEDLEDICKLYFRQFEVPLPPRSEWPVEMPADPTMVEFALWLDAQASAASL